MSTLILGAGKVGFQLAKRLIEANEDVVLVEKDPERAAQVSELLDCMVINYRGTSPEVLKAGAIQKADFFISVTDSDEVNLVACGVVASNFEVPCKIARVRNIDYFGPAGLKQAFLGIDYIINPETEVARDITRAIERGAVSDIMFFEKAGLQMRSITVGPDSLFSNKTIQEISNTLEIKFLVAVIMRNNDYIIPSGDLTIQENDKLYLIATEEDFKQIFEHIGENTTTLKRIVVLGGNRIGQYVVEHLLEGQKKGKNILNRFLLLFRQTSKKRIDIIESDPDNCRTLSDRFPEALVINADISDENFSEEEHFAGADLVIATTDNQELNIVNAVYAKRLGVKRTIALVNKASYLNVASDLGIDVAINPVHSMVTTILSHMSASHIRSVHSISGGNIDVIELSVEAANQCVDKRIQDIRLPSDTLIISVTRDGNNIMPHGNLTLREGDYLIIIARIESSTKVHEVFSV